jgi:hypothetical protein
VKGPGERPEEAAVLAAAAEDLAAAATLALGPWVVRQVRRRATEAGVALRPDAVAAAEAAAAEAEATVLPALRALLAADIDAQRTNPLAVLRGAVRYPTAVLVGLGVPPVVRDGFAERAFPEDVYDLSPAAFADVDESLHEPGLRWGAAKAFVHRRRHVQG